jgi:hypothetical protein
MPFRPSLVWELVHELYAQQPQLAVLSLHAWLKYISPFLRDTAIGLTKILIFKGNMSQF